MSYSTDPAADWNRWIEKQESTHDTLHPTDRLLETLAGKNGAIEAEIGEYGIESELLAALLLAAVKRDTGGRGNDRDIAWRAGMLAQEVIKNRDARYWDRVDESRIRAIAARSAA